MLLLDHSIKLFQSLVMILMHQQRRMLADMKRLSDVWSSVHNWVWLSLTQLCLSNNRVKVNMLQLNTDSMCKSCFFL